jgi:hypothetical protein
MHFASIFALIFTTLIPALCLAQQQAAPSWGKFQVQGILRTRAESWDWFQANQGDGAYSFLGSIARFQFGQQWEHLDWQTEFAVPFLLGLPETATAPGSAGVLGLGGNYFLANQRSQNTAMLFPKQAFLRFKNFGVKGQSLRIGRFEFMDGSELAAKNATLAALKASRINMRLIGHFGWTHVGRSFDGFHYTLARPGGTMTFIGAVPTRGVFQTDGWGWNKSAFSYLSFAKAAGSAKSSGDLRLFGIYYHDWRRVLKVDNRPLTERQTDQGNIGIWTWGGHYLHAWETPRGTVDLLLFTVAQHGRWGRLDHRAAAINVEGGWQPKILPRIRPWIRGGYYHGTGDGSPSDGRHQTFFQILPTPRPFARFPFFNMMNNEDVFGMLTVRPHGKVTISGETHSLRLSNRQDLWLLGGGVFQPWTFGYIGRPSNGERPLATLSDVSVDYRINQRWNLNGYFGHASGKSVIAHIYPRSANGNFGYVELSVRLF